MPQEIILRLGLRNDNITIFQIALFWQNKCYNLQAPPPLSRSCYPCIKYYCHLLIITNTLEIKVLREATRRPHHQSLREYNVKYVCISLFYIPPHLTGLANDNTSLYLTSFISLDIYSKLAATSLLPDYYCYAYATLIHAVCFIRDRLYGKISKIVG